MYVETRKACVRNEKKNSQRSLSLSLRPSLEAAERAYMGNRESAETLGACCKHNKKIFPGTLSAHGGISVWRLKRVVHSKDKVSRDLHFSGAQTAKLIYQCIGENET